MRRRRPVLALLLLAGVLHIPTTGAIYKGKLYFIANSQIDLEENGKITDPAKLQPVRIEVVPLP